jgi:long-chain acyl-CoA synthetase
MRGYWEDPELTAKALLPEGWLDTGDLGTLTAGGDLCFRGRAKDTIALRGGEKVEPQPIEDRLAESPWIDQALVVGQDRKVLGAILVPRKEVVGAPDLEATLRAECARLLTEEAGFMAHERISRIAVLREPFTVENGLLTATLKVRRAEALARYASVVEDLLRE